MMRRKVKVKPAKIEVNSSLLVPAWILFGLYGATCTAALWIATAWMLPGISITLTILGAISGFSSPWRFSSFPAFFALALSALYFSVPAGGAVSWRSYVLVGLVTAAFRLFAILSLISPRTEIVLPVLWQQARIWAVLVATAFVVLLLVQVGTSDSQTNQAWLYLGTGALTLVAVICALSLKESKRP